MADIDITTRVQTAQFTKGVEKIKKGVKDVEKTAERVANKARRASGGTGGKGRRGGSAMGLLEVSRGVEDYAVAGMRGALNNIPGIIMSIAPGLTKVAGAASLAAVATMQLVKAYEHLADRSRALKEKLLMPGILYADRSKIIETNKVWIEEMAEAVDDLAAALKKVSGYRVDILNIDAGVEASRDRLKAAQGDSAMQALGFSAEQREDAAFKDRLRNMGRQFEAEKQQLRIKNQNLDVLEKTRVELEQMASPQALAKTEKMNAEIRAMETSIRGDFADRYSYKANNAVAWRRQRIVQRYYGDEGSMEKEIKAEEAARRRLEKVNAEILQLKERIDLDDYALRKAAEKLKLDREAATLEHETARRDKKAAEDAKKADDLAAQRAKFVEGLRINSDGLLSSAGKVGFASMEATNSMNIQKTQTQYLRDIARNSKNWAPSLRN